MTTILAFSDHHGSEEYARGVVRLAQERQVAFLVCGGDFTVFEENWEPSWKLISEAGLPVYFIAGNHETARTCKQVETFHPACRWIGMKVVNAPAVQLAGLDGTDDLSPHHEEDLEAADTYIRLIRAQRIGSLPLILVSHYPPAGTACCGHEPIYREGEFQGHSAGKPLGSRVVRKAVDALSPRIVICGHFHDRCGVKDRIGETLIINPGPSGAVLDVLT